MGEKSDGTEADSKHAILFAGKADGQRHWNNIQRAYSALRLQGYTDAGIHVLAGKGSTDPECPAALKPLVDGAGTMKALFDAITEIGKVMNSGEQFFFFATDHGDRKRIETARKQAFQDAVKEILDSAEDEEDVSYWGLDDAFFEHIYADSESIPYVGIILDFLEGNESAPVDVLADALKLHLNGYPLSPDTIRPIYFLDENPDLDGYEIMFPIVEKGLLTTLNLLELEWASTMSAVFTPFRVDTVLISTGDISDISEQVPEPASACCENAQCTIPAGYDLFVTDPDETFLDFSTVFFPPGFFPFGSQLLAGKIYFEGVPLGSYDFPGMPGVDLGDVDTIVHRLEDATYATYSGSHEAHEVPIEVVALSLRSVEPIGVQILGHADPELWDVELTNTTPIMKPGGDKMTIVLESEEGGTFTSQLTIFPKLVFTRRSDGEQKTLDLPFIPFMFTSSGTPWTFEPPDDALVIPEINECFFVRELDEVDASNGDLRHKHRVLFAPAEWVEVYDVASDVPWPPFEWSDADGNLLGFDLDLMRCIAALQGFEIEILNYGWEALIYEVGAGHIDIGASATPITDELETQVDFSDPYWLSDQEGNYGFFVAEGDPNGLLPLLNDGLMQLLEMGVYDNLVRAYMGTDLEVVEAAWQASIGLLHDGDIAGFAQLLADLANEY